MGMHFRQQSRHCSHTWNPKVRQTSFLHRAEVLRLDGFGSSVVEKHLAGRLPESGFMQVYTHIHGRHAQVT